MDGYPLPRFFIFCLLSIGLIHGCGTPISSPKASAPPFNGGGGGRNDAFNPVPEAPASEVAGMFVKMTSKTGQPTLHRADVQYVDGGGNRNTAGTGNFSTECRIQSTATGDDRDLFCIAEVEELDLYFSQFTMQFHVPPSMCSYIAVMPYHFYAFEPGNGPTLTSHQEYANGTIVDVTDTLDGVPQCTYDYSMGDGTGPNCCLGEYTRVVTRFDADGVPTTDITTGVSWGGKLANCLAGPAMTNMWNGYRSTETNLPKYRVESVSGVGFNSSITLPAAINSRAGGITVSSSVFAANFYNPLQHVGGPGSVPAGEDIRRPVALRLPANVTATNYFPQDSYILDCLDRAEEVSARIRVMIREWNTAPIVQGGDPDFDDGSGDPGFPGEPLNDRLDWLDFGATYPGYNI